MQERFDMRMDQEFKSYIQDIRGLLQERDDKQGRGTRVTNAAAVRFAISFCHKQLTEVLNPEDLRDDNL